MNKGQRIDEHREALVEAIKLAACRIQSRRMKGRQESQRIVDKHGEMTVAMLQQTHPELTGQYVGHRIVAMYGGRTGAMLAQEMLRC